MRAIAMRSVSDRQERRILDSFEYRGGTLLLLKLSRGSGWCHIEWKAVSRDQSQWTNARSISQVCREHRPRIKACSGVALRIIYILQEPAQLSHMVAKSRNPKMPCALAMRTPC